jgi:hypothetical protein
VAADLVVRTTGPDPSVTVYPRRGKQVLVLVGSVAFVAGSIWLLTFDSPRAVVAGVLGTVVFGLFGVLATRLALQRGPALVIDSRGITDSSSAVSAGFVPWHQVTGLHTWNQGSREAVCVDVHDPRSVLAAAGPFARITMRLNTKMVGTPVIIAVAALPLTGEQLIAEIAAVAPR